MSSKQIQDLKILRVLSNRSRRSTIKLNQQTSVPMGSVKLFHPEQPSDQYQQDQTSSPEEIRYFESNKVILDNNKSLPDDYYQREFGYYTFDQKYLKRTNTEGNLNDLSTSYFRSIKLLFQEKLRLRNNYYIKKFLSDIHKGNIVSQKNSLKFLDLYHQCFHHLIIIIISPLQQLFDQNNSQFAIIISIFFMNIIIFLLQIRNYYLNIKNYTNQQKNKIYYTGIQIALIFIQILNYNFNWSKEILITNICILTLISAKQIIQSRFIFGNSKLFNYLIVIFILCHVYSSLQISLEIDQIVNLSFYMYCQTFYKFFGYFVNLCVIQEEFNSSFEYIYIMFTWLIFQIIKIEIFLELLWYYQQYNWKYKNERNYNKYLDLFSQINMNNKQINKILYQIEQNQKQYFEITKLKNEFIMLDNLEQKIGQQILKKQKQKAFQQFHFLQKLSYQTKENLINEIEICFYKNGDQIFVEDNLDDGSIYFIYKGQVQLQNKLHKIYMYKQNNIFGQYSFITGLPRQSSVISIGESCLFKLKRMDLLLKIQENQLDKELINYIKDEIIQKSKFELIELKCLNCDSCDHLIGTCPQLHLLLNREQIIMNLLQPIKQRRHEYKRMKHKSSNTLSTQYNNMVKCQELQDDFGYVSSLGETDHTNFQQNPSHYTQSSINFPSKILGTQSKSIFKVPTIEPLDQESLKEQQFKEIDQLFIRTQNPKTTTVTAGFGGRETNSQKSPKNENNTIDEQQSENSSESESYFEDEDVSAADKRRKLLRSSTNKSDKHSQFKSVVSSISMSNTPKQQSQISLLGALKSDLNNNVHSGSNPSSLKNISPMQSREKEERTNTLTIPANLLQIPSKKSLINPISQLNYEASPFITFSQHLFDQGEKNFYVIEIDKNYTFQLYYPKQNVEEILRQYRIDQKLKKKETKKTNLLNKQFNTL